MKKSLILGILGLAAGTVASYGQGAVFLDNYQASTFNPIYQSAALGGGKLPAGFTVQLYYDPTAGQNIAAAINTAAASAGPTADPISLSASLEAATGAGSTAPIFTLASLAGYFSASAAFLIQPSGTAGESFTMMVVAYNGSTYDASTIRGYSPAVYEPDVATTSPLPGGADIGLFFPQGTSLGPVPMFQVYTVPEPGTLALAGLGGLSLLLFRRKQS